VTPGFGRRPVLVTGREVMGPYVRLAIHDPGGEISAPGRFHMLAARDGWGGGDDERPYLPRALAPLRCDPAPTGGGVVVEFVLHDVGPGTHRLCGLRPGDPAWLLGPLGGGFRPAPEGHRPVLVAGGISVPPIAHLAGTLLDRKGAQEPFVAAGFRDRAHAVAALLLPGEAAVATDDGSAGHSGRVTELLEDALDADLPSTVYACGPGPMLEAVRRICVDRGVPGQLALESPMACGFGACFGCVVPLVEGGYARVCVDGPVIDADRLAEVPA
jgi:dihydroorotate dehydrogenase electron transfer subunit